MQGVDLFVVTELVGSADALQFRVKMGEKDNVVQLHQVKHVHEPGEKRPIAEPGTDAVSAAQHKASDHQRQGQNA